MNRPTSEQPPHDSSAVKAAIAAAVERFRVERDQVVELRGLDTPSRHGKPFVAAGWFDDVDALTQAAFTLDARGAQVYITLNPVNSALLCRACNRVIEGPARTTADHDVVRRTWLPFDFDAVRPAGTSASDDELAITKERAQSAASWLTDALGAAPDIWAFSGNGYHLLFRVDLPNDERSTKQIRGIIEKTAEQLSDDRVSVDRTVYNAARIWRLYGTTNRKGDSVAKLGRVHRRSAILGEGFH